VEILNRKMKHTIYIAIAILLWNAPVHASCYTWNPGDTATINLENPKNSYYRIWKDKKKLKLVAKLRHGNKIEVIKFIGGVCGGDVYLESKVNGRNIRGWTDSENLTFLTR
jgi:hypothetical protein